MKNKDLMIYQDVKNETLRLFLDRLEEEYGSILSNTGGTVWESEKWISPKAVAAMALELDRELRGE